MLLCLLWFGMPALAFADSESGDWVEENISPSTEWVERAFVPFTRWMEKAIQDPSPSNPQGDFVSEVPDPLPIGVIPPSEAARLLTLIQRGKVLRVQWLATEPPVYVLRLLSRAGRIQLYYMNAKDGTLLEQAPAPKPFTSQGENHEDPDR